MSLLFMFVVFLFLLHSNNLLLCLILLEIISFFTLFFVSTSLGGLLTSDFLVLAIFSVFVMEGVVALSGLISLVTFTGSDYLSSSSFLNL